MPVLDEIYREIEYNWKYGSQDLADIPDWEQKQQVLETKDPVLAAAIHNYYLASQTLNRLVSSLDYEE